MSTVYTAVERLSAGGWAYGCFGSWVEVEHPPEFEPQAGDPVRVDLSAERSGLFIEPKVSVAYLPTQGFDPATKISIDSELKTPYFTFWPRTLGVGSEGLRQVEGETVLGRLNRLYLDASLLKKGPLSASAALEWLLDRFQERAPWLSWEPVPPLYVLGPEGPYEPQIDVVSVIPDEQNPKSFAAVIRDWLGPFYGYSLAVTPEGKLMVLGPWWLPQRVITIGTGSASFTVYLTPIEVLAIIKRGSDECRKRVRLADGDSQSVTTPCGTLDLSLSGKTVTATLGGGADEARLEAYTPPDYLILGTDGEEARAVSTDTSRVVNHVIVRNEGYYDYVSDAAVCEDSHFRVWGAGFWCFPLLRGFDRPTNADLGSPSDHDLGLVKWIDHRDDWTQCTWITRWLYVGRVPPVANTIIGGEFLTVDVTVKWWGDQCGDFPGPGHLGDRGGTFQVPVNGEATYTVQAPVPGAGIPPCTYAYLELRARPRYTGDGVFDGLDVWVRGLLMDIRWGLPPPGGDGRWILGAGVFLTVTGERWQKASDTKVGEWGEDPAGQDGITPGLSQSVDRYGERRKEITISTYSLPSETLLHMARTVVERNLSPAKLVEVLVPPPYLPRPLDLGQRVKLAGDEIGELEEWRYTEAHAPGQNRANVTVRVRVTESLIKEELDRCAWGEAAYNLGYWCP